MRHDIAEVSDMLPSALIDALRRASQHSWKSQLDRCWARETWKDAQLWREMMLTKAPRGTI